MWKIYFEKMLVLGALTSVAAFAYAQEKAKDSIKTNDVEKVTIIGSRNKSRVATDTPVPVDVLNISELAVAAPQTDLNQILNYVAPSFTSNAMTVADGTDHIDPAQLRGLGPDQVLVLLNGKRRHNSSLVNVNGTPGRGSVGTDLNAIPAFSIDRIEVLRDGASSQYGSDAIAGVINVVMKRATGKLDLQLSSGANVTNGANDNTGGMDGEKLQLDANYGFKVGDKGFVNLTGTVGWRNPTSRAGTWNGTAFNLYNAVEQRARENGTILSGLFDRVSGGVATLNGTDVTNNVINTIHQYASQVGYLTAAQQSAIANTNSITGLQSLLKTDVTDNELSYRGLTRKDINMRVGQSKASNVQFMANSIIPINDKLDFYWFGGYGYRDGNSAGFYRRADQNRDQSAFYPNGFLPEIGSTIKDFSLAGGLKGEIMGWDFDFSNTYGQNKFDYTILNTANVTMPVNPNGSFQNEFDSGGLKYGQNSVNLDFSKNYDVLSGLNVAFGSEFRTEMYKIRAGEEASWAQYNVDGTINTVNPNGNLPTDFFGSSRPGGAQVFPGFRPENAVNETRNNIAFYVDTEFDLTKAFLVEVAGRFENYSDFGSTFNYKVATRYKLGGGFALRGAISSGFRAPSLAQRYFNSTSTIFVNGIATEQGLFRNDSQLAVLLGIPSLKQEESNNYSFGVTWKIPNTRLSLTTDGYYIKIKNRIVMTGAFSPTPATQALFNQAGATSASFFANAIDTQTRGLDVVLSNVATLGKARLKSDLALALTKTERIGDIHSSDKLKGSESTYFSESSRIYLQEAVPRAKLSFMNTLTLNKFDIYSRLSYFGKVTDPNTGVADGITKVDANGHPVYGGKVITDASVSYAFTKMFRLTVGANNLFDTYPDKNLASLTSGDQFIYSRAVSQFGFAGRYLFARVNLTF